MELLKNHALLVLASFLLLITSCATTPDARHADRSSLDVASKANDPSLTKAVAPQGEGVKPMAVFNWQAYFKAPPTQAERVTLEKTLSETKRDTSKSGLLKRARGEVALGRFASADATYREVLRKDRDDIDAMIELAAVYHKSRKSDQALQVLSDAKDIIATQEKPDHLQIFRYRYLLALVEIQRGRRNIGHEILSDLIGQEKSFVPGYAALASSYIAIGKDQVAKFVIERGLDRGRDDAGLYNLLGVISERQSKAGVAKEHYNKALKINDSFAPALVNRGNIYLRSGEMSLAEADFKKALEIDPLNTDAMISLAVVQRQSGRHELAKAQVQRVLEIMPESPEARFNLAIIMRDHAGNSAEAMRLFREVSQTDKATSELKAQAKSAVDDMKNL
jgi:tetratricopeptide (TPR) repeat protein